MNTRPRTLLDMVMLTLRLGLGALFLYTGAGKAMDPMSFLMNVRSFQILPDPYAAWVAMGLPWLEILTGLALLTGVLVEGALTCLAGMLGVFLWAFIYSWQRGLDVSCGCFGKQDAATDYTQAITQDVLLLAVTLALLIHRWFRRRRPRGIGEDTA
jgi:putative oxidoreductase